MRKRNDESGEKMPTKVSISSSAGFEDFLSELSNADKDVDAVVDRALLAGAQPILEEMKRLVPKDTKNLLAHIRVKGPTRTGNDHQIEVGIIQDRTLTDPKTAIYANVMEFGSSSVKASPYIRPGYDHKKKEAIRVMKQVFEEELMP